MAFPSLPTCGFLLVLVLFVLNLRDICATGRYASIPVRCDDGGSKAEAGALTKQLVGDVGVLKSERQDRALTAARRKAREIGVDDESEFGEFLTLEEAASNAITPRVGSAQPELVHEDFWLVCTMDGTVHARNSASGNEMWQTSLGEPLVQSFNSFAPTIGKVVPGDDGSLYIYTHDDKLERYELTIPELVNASPKVQELEGVGKLIIVGEFTTVVYSLDVATGRVVLKTSVRDAIKAEESFLEPDELVNIAKRVYTVRAFEEFSGKEVWNFTYGKFETPDAVLADSGSRVPNGSGSRLTLGQVPVSSIFSVSRLLNDGSEGGVHERTCPVEEVAPYMLPAEPTADAGLSATEEQGVTLVRVQSADGRGELMGTAYPLGPDLNPFMENGLPSPQDLPSEGTENKVLELVSNSSDGASVGLLRFSTGNSPNPDLPGDDKLPISSPGTLPSSYQNRVVAYSFLLVAVMILALLAGITYKRKPRERWVNDSTLEVGKLTVNLDQVKGRGCHGTVVYSGKLGKRPVAVKRMLSSMYDVANKEVELLIRSDGHPNVVRYFAQEKCRDFVYLALELCTTTMDGAIRRMKSADAENDQHISVTAADVRFLSELVSAVSHLHDLRIVHCDIKPQNILLIESASASSESRDFLQRRSFGEWSPKLSDMGLGRKISDSTSSIGIGASTTFSVGYGESQNLSSMQGAGTQGWRAAELLQKLAGVTGRANDRDVAVRCGRMVDVFSLGCVFFYTLTLGYHPFGDFFEREKNILNGTPKALDRITGLGEAHDLIRQMLQKEPEKRPTLRGCQEHPFFWSAERRIQFLCTISNQLKVDKASTNRLKALLDSRALASKVHSKTGWFEVLDGVFKQDLSAGAHAYDYWSTCDLLRFIRNKFAHLQELRSLDKNGIVSSTDKFWKHFNDRFPKLLLTCYHVICATCAHETSFKPFLGEEVSERNEERSRKWQTEVTKQLQSKQHSCRGWFINQELWMDANNRLGNKGNRQREKLRPAKYKVTLCSHWERTGGTWCAKGKQCGFAHGRFDLRHRRLIATEKASGNWRQDLAFSTEQRSPRTTGSRTMRGPSPVRRQEQASLSAVMAEDPPPPPPGFENFAKARPAVR